MGHSSVRIKVRRRKVATLAAFSRQHTVNNMPKNKPTFDKKECYKQAFGDGKDVHYIQKIEQWDPKKYPQPKLLRKATKGLKWIRLKDGTVQRVKWEHHSQFQNNKPKLWKDIGIAEKMEAYVQDKLKKWEKKHPKPCPDDDLFKDEMIPAWEAEKEQALIHIRDFVVSMFDKLPLSGRFKVNEKTASYQEKQIAELKDINGDGHRVNELGKDSKLLKKAQEITNKTHAKHANLVSTNLKDHKRKKGRVLLPQAA